MLAASAIKLANLRAILLTMDDDVVEHMDHCLSLFILLAGGRTDSHDDV